MVAKRRHAFPVEDPVHADFEFFFARQAMSSDELERFPGDVPPLV